MSIRVPSYRRHSSGLAFVEINGKRLYLGVHGSEESEERYRRLVAERFTKRSTRPADGPACPWTIALLVTRYKEHCEKWYTKDGKPTSEVDNIRQAVRYLRQLYDHLPVVEFGPLAMKTVRQKMIEAGRARSTINRDIRRIRSMFKWAVGEELVPSSVLHGLQAVSALTRGRTEAKEAPPIEPVPPEEVEATLPYLSAQAAAMVRLQLLAGMRPKEVCDIRPRDVTLADGVMVYRPGSHKTEHHGKERRIFLGPKAQEVLRPWLGRDADAYCFDPRETVAAWMRDKRLRRKSKVQPSQQCRAKRYGKRKRQPQERYTSASYRRAIARGCEKRAKAEGIAVDTWAPNQLRHTRATELRAHYGIEAAQAVLGHSDPKTTLVYAERDFAKAAEIMRQIG